MENEKKNYTQLPNKMGLDKLEPKDQLIYLCIHRFINPGTKVSMVSLAKLKDLSGADIKTIKKSINRLKEQNYITVDTSSKCTKYKFNAYTRWENFSYNFLDKKDLSFTSKAYICASQQYMFKDNPGEGKISYTNNKLAELINSSPATISRCNNELIRKGYMVVLENKYKDPETGCLTETKLFDLSKLCQSVIWKIQEHDTEIQENKEDINILQKQYDKLAKAYTELEKTNEAMLRRLENLEKSNRNSNFSM